MTRYRFADLVLASDVPLPALPVAGDEPSECSFRLLGPSPGGEAGRRWEHHWRLPGGSVSLSCARDGGAWHLGFPGLASFTIDEEGREIECRPEPGLPANTLEHLLADQVLPRVLTLRGRLTLHAGCVATPEGAIALLGDSGAGKSTLCAAFVAAGGSLIGDDAIVVSPLDAGGFGAQATYPGLRLFPEPVIRLFGEVTHADPVAHTTGKMRVRVGAAAAGPSPLRGIYLLSVGNGDGVAVAPLSGGEAFLALLRGTFSFHASDSERSRCLFDRIAALVDAVPVRRLSYPRDFARLDDVRVALDRGVSPIRATRSPRRPPRAARA